MARARGGAAVRDGLLAAEPEGEEDAGGACPELGFPLALLAPALEWGSGREECAPGGFCFAAGAGVVAGRGVGGCSAAFTVVGTGTLGNVTVVNVGSGSVDAVVVARTVVETFGIVGVVSETDGVEIDTVMVGKPSDRAAGAARPAMTPHAASAQPTIEQKSFCGPVTRT
ncbi:MAG TPA: hypothetical protein VGU02_15750 [Gaiellaceae bacterium]|nr:hypothetical protein [Gaiellaceae bacterium]